MESYGGFLDLPKCCDCFPISAPGCTDTLIFNLLDHPETDVDIQLRTPLGKVLTQTQTTDGAGDLRIDLSVWRERINYYSGPYVLRLFYAGTNEPLWAATDYDLRQCFILTLESWATPPLSFTVNTTVNECDCRPCRNPIGETTCDPCGPSGAFPPETPDCTRFEFSVNVTGVTPFLPTPSGEPEIKGGVFSGDDETGVLLFLSGELIAPNDNIPGLMMAWINFIQTYTKVALPSTEFALSGNTLTVSFDRAEFIALYGYDACDRNIALVSRDTDNPLYPNTIQAIINKLQCC